MEHIRLAAIQAVSRPFESGKLFKDDDMKQMEQLSITNMSHSSLGDRNAHYSVQDETSAGSKVKGNHAQEDKSKQTLFAQALEKHVRECEDCLLLHACAVARRVKQIYPTVAILWLYAKDGIDVY
ncbi:unnamed protein product [Penicillium viridicatum]